MKSGAVEQFVFQAELTNRDKDHVSEVLACLKKINSSLLIGAWEVKP